MISSTAPTNSGMTKFELHPDGDIPVLRLDDTIPAEEPVDLMKIDTEGAEQDILKGATNVIKNNYPLIYI